MPQLNPGSWKLGLQRARLTLHESDPVTGNEEALSSLFYEYYRGYTIYSTARGRCCIHGTLGCLKLLGKFVCFYDIEEAKTFIKHLRRAGYRACDRVERYLPPEDYVWLNCWTRPRHNKARQRVACSQPRRDGNQRGRLPTLSLSERSRTRDQEKETSGEEK